MKRQGTHSQLRLSINEDSRNHFVRLSTCVAKDLKDVAIAALEGETDVNGLSWTIEDDCDDYTFLPLAISVLGTTVYASFNGGVLEEPGTIEVPRALLSEFQNLPSTVTVEVLPSIHRCTSVDVEPVSVEDWELLEVYAQELEMGGLLQQVSVVYPNQLLRLCLGRDMAHVVVKSSSVNQKSSVWSTAEATSEPCVLLIETTEFIVTPKPRPSESPTEWSSPLRLIPCIDDWNKSMLQMAKLAGTSPLLVPPGCILVNKASWSSKREWAKVASYPPVEDQNQLLRVLVSPLVPEQQAALHPWIRFELGLALYWGSVRLQPVTPPKEVDSIESIALELVQPEQECTLSSWRLPDVRSATDMPCTTVLEKGADQWMLPIGSIISESSLLVGSTRHNVTGDKFFRIVSSKMEERSRLAKRIISLDQPNRLQLFESYGRRYHLDEDAGDTIRQPLNDQLSNWSPELLLSTTEWMESSLEYMVKKMCPIVIIQGPTGIGKTYSSLVLSSMARIKQNRATLYLDCKRLQESTNSLVEILTELDTLFEEALKARSCLVILDDLHRLTPNLLAGEDDDPATRVHSANPTAVNQSKLIADRIVHLIEASRNYTLDSTIAGKFDLAVVISCPSIHSLNASLLQSNTKNLIVSVPVLSTKERVDVLVQRIQSKVLFRGKMDYANLGTKTEGFRPRDLEKISSRVQQEVHSTEDVNLESVVVSVIDNFLPLSQMHISRPVKSHGPSWSEIGGLFEVKAKLETILLHPVKYHLVYQEASIRLPRGILLFGPPGCGKSILMQALARKCNFPLISCKGPEVLDKYIGASEAKVRELFNRALSVAPSILFLDELDALAPRRGSDHTGVTDRVVNQMLTFLDGVEDASTGTVYVVGATARPDKVDPALLRPGRLEQHLFVGPPTEGKEWIDLFSKIAAGWNVSAGCIESMESETAFTGIMAQVTSNPRFSPADVRAALATAHVIAVHRALKSTQPEAIQKIEIQEDDLRAALCKTRPSLNKEDARSLEEVYRPFRKISKEPNGLSKEDRTLAYSRKLKTTLK